MRKIDLEIYLETLEVDIKTYKELIAKQQVSTQEIILFLDGIVNTLKEIKIDI